jgi:type II secretory pathway pseudopilin PulG
VVALSIIGILLAAAMPLYMNARLGSYKAEANRTFEDIKTMEWAYYQQYSTFVNATPATIGFMAPASANWNYSIGSGTATSIAASATGMVGSPVQGQTMTLTLNNDGSVINTASF